MEKEQICKKPLWGKNKFVKNFYGGVQICERPLYGGKSKFVKNFYGGVQICERPLYGGRANL